MEKIGILKFYQELSSILENYRIDMKNKDKYVQKLTELLELAKYSELNVDVDINFIDNIERFDDEFSYRESDEDDEDDYYYDSSY